MGASAPAPLSHDESEQVDLILKRKDVTFNFRNNQVTHDDILRLIPGRWLNDEIVNFYGAMIVERSKERRQDMGDECENDASFLKVHCFSTFFWKKLCDCGYEVHKGGLAHWTKDVSGIWPSFLHKFSPQLYQTRWIYLRKMSSLFLSICRITGYFLQ